MRTLVAVIVEWVVLLSVHTADGGSTAAVSSGGVRVRVIRRRTEVTQCADFIGTSSISVESMFILTH